MSEQFFFYNFFLFSVTKCFQIGYILQRPGITDRLKERRRFMDELYSQNAKIVYYFLYKKCHDRQLAEDLTQETFLQAYQSIERFDGSCKISVWLCQIAKHLLYRHWEKQKREIPMDLEMQDISSKSETADAGSQDTAWHQASVRIELIDVLKEMQKLPAERREVIYLRITGALSFKEIGEIMGKSENWARVSFYRGKEQLLKGRMNYE